jgi:GT2 family glycosyltransferase
LTEQKKELEGLSPKHAAAEQAVQDSGASVNAPDCALAADLAAKNELVREQAEKIAQLQHELSEAQARDRRSARNIDLLEREKKEISSVLESMKGSVGWKLVRSFRRAKNRLLPLGTRRRRWYDKSLVRLKNPPPRSESRTDAPPAPQRSGAEVSPPGDGFYRARLVLLSVPTVVDAGQTGTVRVELTNLSPSRWLTGKSQIDTQGRVALSYHWYDSSGGRLLWEGEHTCLPRDLEPENSVTVDIRVFAPFAPGAYTLQIALLQEDVARFSERGSVSLKTAVQVKPSPVRLPQLPSCSIVIPVFDRAAFTRACLLAIERSVPANTVQFEVIVVDNGSTDGTPGILDAWSSSRAHARLVSLGRNLGFARACNEGVKLARGDYLVLLNNDTLPTPGWLESMLRLAEDEPQAGIVGSKLLYPDGRIQHLGVAFGEDKSPRHIYRGYSSNIRPAKLSREYQAVTAACLLMKKEIYSMVGGLDEGYLNSYEDADLCLKVRARGYRVLVCADSIVYHFEGTSEGRLAHDVRNAALFKSRWEDKIEVDLDRWYSLDHFGKETSEFEPHEGYDPRKDKQLRTLWKRIYSCDIPELG